MEHDFKIILSKVYVLLDWTFYCILEDSQSAALKALDMAIDLCERLDQTIGFVKKSEKGKKSKLKKR